MLVWIVDVWNPRTFPNNTEFHFSALHHGDYVLWAELWFVVVCRCVK